MMINKLATFICAAAFSAFATAGVSAGDWDFSDSGAFSFNQDEGSAFKALKDSTLSISSIANNSTSPNKSLEFLVVAFDSQPPVGIGTDALWFNAKDSYGKQGGIYNLPSGSELPEGVAWTERVTLDETKAEAMTSQYFTENQYGAVFLVDSDASKLYSGTLGTDVQTAEFAGIGDATTKGIYAYYDPTGSDMSSSVFVLGGAPVTPAASGSPLPGVWVTMALAGAVGGYLKHRKNRS